MLLLYGKISFFPGCNSALFLGILKVIFPDLGGSIMLVTDGSVSKTSPFALRSII